jgi:hypothetical protein
MSSDIIGLSWRDFFVVILRLTIVLWFEDFFSKKNRIKGAKNDLLVRGFSWETKSRSQNQISWLESEGFSRRVLICNLIECTGWSKCTCKVQLLVPEVIFRWFGSTKRCAIIGFLETVLCTRGLGWIYR